MQHRRRSVTGIFYKGDFEMDERNQMAVAEQNQLTPVEFGFDIALHMLKGGSKVARRGWNGKGMFLFLVRGSTFEVNRPPLLGIYPEGTVINYRPHIDMRTASGDIVAWVASQSDLLEADWYMVA